MRRRVADSPAAGRPARRGRQELSARRPCFGLARAGAGRERKGTPDTTPDKAEFKRRFLSQFPDPAFDPPRADLDRVAAAASPSPLKLMTDRLVCADGGNPDPSRTHGKDATRAKEIELAGWDYPKHLSGRLFSVVAHGDVEGVENVRRSISDWLCFMGLCPAGPLGEVDRYIGYFEPYATSHEALDRDLAIQEEARNAARTLLEGVQAIRSGRQVTAGNHLKAPRQK